MEYRKIEENEINCELFSHYIRHQLVTKCWRKIDGEWCIEDIAFVEDWGQAEYEYLVKCLLNTVRTGGLFAGAFDDGKLKGFISVESEFLGSEKQYLELSSMHTSEDMRGKGVGRELFGIAKQWAKEHGAKKLYISGHSSVESQAFYKAMGCVEAEEYDKAHVEKEPCDCQLECVL